MKARFLSVPFGFACFLLKAHFISLSLMSEQDHAQDPCRMALVLFSIHFFDSTITLGTRYITMYILYHSIYFILIIFAD